MLARLLELRSQEKALKVLILDAEVEIYKNFANQLDKEEGSFNIVNEGYKVKIVKKNKIVVDQMKAAQLSDIAFKAKYSLDKKAYKLLSDDDKSAVDDCLTTSPAKPSFTVEKLEE